MPKISVLLTSLNHARFICEAIDSVLAQSFADYELIICDDHSDDDSWDIIRLYDDPRIAIHRNSERRGGSWLVNQAIETFAQGDYIAIHHSDDVWEADKLARQVEFLEQNPTIAAVFTQATVINESGEAFTDTSHFYFNVFNQPNRTRHEWLHHFFRNGNGLCHPSVLIRKQAYRDCGVLRNGLMQLADYDLWIRLCLKHEIHVLPEKLIRFRVRDQDANHSGSQKDNLIRMRFEMLELYDNYRAIDQFGELIKIFPQCARYRIDGEGDVGYALAMAALEDPRPPTTPLCVAPLLGMNLLFDILSDPGRAARARRLYGFDQIEFARITGQHDLFVREQPMLAAPAPAPASVIRRNARWRRGKPGKIHSQTFRRRR